LRPAKLRQAHFELDGAGSVVGHEEVPRDVTRLVDERAHDPHAFVPSLNVVRSLHGGKLPERAPGSQAAENRKDSLAIGWNCFVLTHPIRRRLQEFSLSEERLETVLTSIALKVSHNEANWSDSSRFLPRRFALRE
jgi:hypothetical protein